MDYLRDLSDFIDDLPDRDSHDPIIQKLPELERKMVELARKLRAHIETFRTTLRREQPAPSAAPPIPSNLDANWVACRRRRRSHAPVQSIPRALEPTREIVVSLSPNMSLRCIEIMDIGEIRTDGTLYFIVPMQRFAIRLAGVIIHGNIGEVYTSSARPHRLHDCEAYPRCDMTTCTYYHNPFACTGSTDTRNFVATSWLYHPGAALLQGQKKMRKVATRSALDADILAVTHQDLQFYNEQLMHDILCNILMNYYVRHTDAAASHVGPVS